MTDRRVFFAKLKLELGPQAWHNFRYDSAASVLFGFFNVVFNQFYVTMAIREGASNLQVGLLSAAPAIGLLFSPIWAGFIERTTPKPFMIIPNLIGRTLIVLPAFFGVPIVYVSVALLFQILMGIQAPAYASLVTRIYPPKHRGMLMGNVRVAMGAMMIPIAYLVGSWTDASGPSGPLIFAAFTGVLSILIFTRIKEFESNPVKPIATKRAALRDQWSLVKHNRELAVFLLVTTLSGFCNILANPLYQIIQVDRLQLSNLQIGYARIAYYVCLLAAYYIVGWTIDRFSAKHTLKYGLLAYAVIPLLYGIFGNYEAVILGSGIQGIGDAIWDIGILAYIFRLAPGREAVVFGLHLMLFGIRGTIGPLLSTLLAGTVPMSALLIGASVFGWAGAVIFLLLNKNKEVKQTGSSLSG